MAADGSIIIDTRINTGGFNKGAANLKSQFAGLGGAVTKLGGLIAAAFSVKEIIAFGKEAIRLGSDLQEVQNVVDVTFTTMNEHVNEFAKNAAKTAGISETMAKRYTGTFGAMAKSFKFTEEEAYNMATTLTQMAGDVASFYNLTQDEAYTKLKSVFTGETESLKDLGVVMTQTALDDFALRKGLKKTTSQMTEQEKVALRYQFVLEQLNGASGDFLRTSDSWANQTRLLSLQFDTLKATIGQGLINALTPAIKVVNEMMAKLQVLADRFLALTKALFGDAGSGSSGIQQAADSAGELAENIAKAGKAAKKALAPFDEIVKLGTTKEDAAISTTIGIGSNAPGGKTEESSDGKEYEIPGWIEDLQQYGPTAENILTNLKTAFYGLKDAAKALWEDPSLGFWLDDRWAIDQLEITSNKLAALGEMLAGIATGDWDRFWNGLKMGAEAGQEEIENTFGEHGLTGSVMGAGASLGEALKTMSDDIKKTWDDINAYLEPKTTDIYNTVVSALNKLICAIIDGVNYIARALNTIKVTFPDWAILGELRGKSYGVKLNEITAPQIPYLAQGAVIPPNREFMAVLGDQNNGYNLEGPESMFRSIVREEIAAFLSDMMTGFEAVVNEQKNTQDIIRNIDLGDTTIGQAAGRYNSKMNTARGGA